MRPPADGFVAMSRSLLLHAAAGIAVVYLIGSMIAGVTYLAIGGQTSFATVIAAGWIVLVREIDAGDQTATMAMMSWMVLGTALGVGRHAWKDWHRV